MKKRGYVNVADNFLVAIKWILPRVSTTDSFSFDARKESILTNYRRDTNVMMTVFEVRIDPGKPIVFRSVALTLIKTDRKRWNTTLPFQFKNCLFRERDKSPLKLVLFQGSYGIVKLAYNEEDDTHYVSA
jgi:hypothetical protein